MKPKRIQDFVEGVIVKGAHGHWAFPNETKKLFKLLDLQLLSRDTHFLETSKYVFELLSKTAFPASCLMKMNPPKLYRRVSSAPPANDPLSVMGSFGAGGRLNVGASQASGRMTKIFGLLAAKRPALYLSEDVDTVRMEYGDYGMPKSTAVTYEVTFLDPAAALTIIDLDLAVAELGKFFAALPAIINRDSVGAIYGDVKVIMATQLMANWLQAGSPQSIHGFKFESTRNPGGYQPLSAFCKRRSMEADSFGPEDVTGNPSIVPGLAIADPPINPVTPI